MGYICSTSLGWPPSFYIFGGTGILWVISWFFFGASTPAKHKSITVEEKNYIENSIGAVPKVIEQASCVFFYKYTELYVYVA